jgi:MFS family permease
MSEYWRRVRAFSPSLRRLALVAALVFTAGLGLVNVLYNLYVVRLGFATPAVGLLGGVGALVLSLAALPAGLLSNRIGLRNSLQLGCAVYGLGIALTLLVERLPQMYWLPWLIASQVVRNVGGAFAAVNAPPYIMAVTDEYERSHAFAFIAAVIATAAFVGSVLAGVLPGMLAGWQGMTLAEPAPYRLAMWLAPLLCWLAVLPLLGADRGFVGAGRAGGAPAAAGPPSLPSAW